MTGQIWLSHMRLSNKSLISYNIEMLLHLLLAFDPISALSVFQLKNDVHTKNLFQWTKQINIVVYSQ